mgnify:CR=1 FL=1
MNAFRCDFCGELFAHHLKITVIDICDTCRCRIQDLLDDIRDDRMKKEKEWKD